MDEPIDPDAVEYIPAAATSTYIKLAAAYGAEYYEGVADRLASHLEAGDRLLDAGTGPGLLPLAVAERAPDVRVEAFDHSGPLVRYGRDAAAERGVDDRVSFFVGDCNAIPVRDGRYPFLVSTGVLHALEEPERALRECHRVLRPGGRAWLFDPTVFDVPADPDLDLTPHERRVLEAYGIQRPIDDPTFTAGDARRLAADSPFESWTVTEGERGDVRMDLRRT